MNARAAIEIGLYSGLVPAATALVVYWLLGRLLPASIAARHRLGAAFAVAVFVGFAVSPTTKALVPTQFWDWIAYLGALAAFVAGLIRAEGVSRAERSVMTVVVAASTAWLIVPTWDELAFGRAVQVAAVAVGIGALAALVEPLARRLPGRGFPFWLMLAAAASALLILAEVSETIGRLAALPAGALLACSIAVGVAKDATESGSLALPYAVVVGGYAYAGSIYPSPPLVLLVVVPFAPLALWICACGPLGRLTGLRAVAAQAICVLLPLVVIGALFIMRGAGEAS